MPYHPLPRYLVESLDAAAYGDSLAHSNWERYRYETQQQLFEMGEFFRSEEEQKAHTFLLETLSSLDQKYGQAGLDLEGLLELTKASSTFAQYFGKFCERRRGENFLKVPELDGLLSVAVATVQGRGGLNALRRFADPAYQRVAGLAESFEELPKDLPSQVREALAQGFDSCSSAFASLTEWFQDTDDMEALERVCTDLKQGGELLEYLYTWEVEAKHETGFRFPVAGAEVARLLEEAQMEALRSGPFLQLCDYWEQASSLLIVPEGQEHLLAEVDELLESLAKGIGEPYSICRQLEESFEKVEESALRLGESDGAWDRLAQFLAASLGGGVPALLVIDTGMSLRESPVEELQQVGVLLGKDFDPDHCAEALRFMLSTSAPVGL